MKTEEYLTPTLCQQYDMCPIRSLFEPIYTTKKRSYTGLYMNMNMCILYVNLNKNGTEFLCYLYSNYTLPTVLNTLRQLGKC